MSNSNWINWWSLPAVFALAFSTMLTLIANLHRAASGAVEVNQQPMFELQQKIESQS